MPVKPRPIADRFWEKVSIPNNPDDCWLWVAALSTSGHGLIGRRKGQSCAVAHRLSWEFQFGAIPEGMEVYHNCDSRYPAGDTTYRRCVNPKHLFLQPNTLEGKFWLKVKKTETCWLWSGNVNNRGYGMFYTGKGKHEMAYRWLYQQLHGLVPKGMFMDHLCRNPLCVNPSHLEVVTPRENVLRGIGPSAKNAKKTHCPKGHEFTPENTITNRNSKKASRLCRKCTQEYDRERNRKKRALLPVKEKPTHFKCGHEKTPENTRTRKDLRYDTTQSFCRKCAQAREARRWQRRKQL